MGTLTEVELADARRLCGYGAKGNVAPSSMTGYRFFSGFTTLEYHLNNLSPSEEQILRERFLTPLLAQETALNGSYDNLDTKEAGPWVWNNKETASRVELFTDTRKRLCEYLGVPSGPAIASGGSIGIKVVV